MAEISAAKGDAVALGRSPFAAIQQLLYYQ